MNERVISVVLYAPSYALDRVFQYLVPEDLWPHAAIGKRVIVPFGKGNRTNVGFIVGVGGPSEVPEEKLKEILEIADKAPWFDEEMLGVIRFMREQYLATYYEAIRTVLPPGVSLRREEYIELLAEKAEGLSPKQKEAVEALRDSGGVLSLSALGELTGSKRVLTVVKALEKKGAVRLYADFKSGVQDKSLRVISLNIPVLEAEELCRKLQKKAPAQARVLEILMDNEEVPMRDLTLFADVGHATVRTLINRGLLTEGERKIERTPLDFASYEKTEAFPPTPEQQETLSYIRERMGMGSNTTVLRGVTGSGKTEVYLRLIEETLKSGRQAVVLVPEISLTPQMIGRFAGRFGERIAVWHSGLSLGERFDQWQRMKEGRADIVIGARSAVFAPFLNIGLFILDEEHEYAYKSETSPRYHAREIAEFRREASGAMVLLSSATPSVETYAKAKVGRYGLTEMTRRYNENELPLVAVVDMRAENEEGNMSFLSRRLREEIAKNVENGEQTILFLNRRGYASAFHCAHCGESVECPYCAIGMTYHRTENRMVCHYCGYKIRKPDVCQKCGGTYILLGAGTEKVEDELHALFPEAGVLRMDADTTVGKAAHERLLKQFSEEKTDILLGTQMVAKGLDFPNVTLAGVLAADLSLNLDDYRADERTFQLLTQVCGRAGRGEKHGRAVVQTFQPEHEVIALARAQDYPRFYEREVAVRKRFYYPPFCHLVSLVTSGPEEKAVREASEALYKKVKDYIDEAGEAKYPNVLFSPMPAPIARLKNQFRHRLLLKCGGDACLREALGKMVRELRNEKAFEAVRFQIDFNPASFQ